MLSQRAHYALRAMIMLAAHRGAEPLRAVQIAQAMNISPKFLENILLSLRKAGYLRSFRGCRGGFVLNQPASKITFEDIVRVTDGSIALSPCVCEVTYVKCEGCFDESRCEIRRALARAKTLTTDVLKTYDFAGVADRLQSAGLLPEIAPPAFPKRRRAR